MYTCPKIFVSMAVVVMAMLLSVSANAESTVLSGMFDGSEPTMASFGNCSDDAQGFQQVPFEITEDGLYQEGWIGTHSSTYRVYERGFNPEQPAQNELSRVGIGWFSGYRLSAGTPYVLVIQNNCQFIKAAWSVSFIGPGFVTSEAAVELPEFSSGVLTESDPVMPTHCGSLWGGWSWGVVDDASYQQSGPIRVSRKGTYYYSAVQIQDGAAVCLLIYSAPVDPSNPTSHQVAMLGGFHSIVELQADTDYYFVTQWSGAEYDDDARNSTGEFLQVLTPPAPIRINSGLSGSWHNPDTPGQGFFLTAYEKINKVFLAWFTYANEASAGDEFGHRWMTALGKFEGESAELAIEWTAGGAFNASNPVPDQYLDGTIELEFTDCTTGQITYDWAGGGGTPAASGVIPIQRLANDSVSLCESLYFGPGMPGPL